MATEQSVTNLKKQLERIAKLEKEQLISRPRWGELNFEDIRLHVERTYGIVGQLVLLPVELLPENTLQNVTQHANQVASSFETLDKFSIGTSSNVAGERQNLINQVQQSTDQFFATTAQWLPYLAYQRGDVERNIQNLTTSVKEAETLVAQAKEKIAARGTEIDDIIIKAREASAAAGAAVFSKDFDRLATNQEDDARLWLKITGVAAILTLVIAGGMWFWAEAGLDQGQLFQKLSTKLVVLAVMLTATIWCGRNYKALKHLATINRHRALSIQTIQAFSASAADVQTKDAVLIEATRAVFGNVPTGYIEDGGGEGDFKIVEVARSILPKSDK